MVEVFKTNVRSKTHSKTLLAALSQAYPTHKINFDLADCDKILRVEGHDVQHKLVIELLTTKGYRCEVLE